MMYSRFSRIAATALWAFISVSRSSTAAEALAPLPVALPGPYNIPTPSDTYSGPQVEPPFDPQKEKTRPPFLAPAGLTNAASKKKVASGAKQIYSGSLPQITDGKKEAYQEDIVEIPKGVQWVQIDLERACTIYAVVIWHDYRELQAFHGVVVQLADDADFTQNVHTIFNNDFENKAGLGMGKDKEYFESREGRIMDAKGTKARYIRCYSNGSSRTAWNAYEEVEVYGLPAN
jgi:hypothetical protein